MADIEDFIAFWHGSAGGAERANYARFLDGLIDVLGLDKVPPGAKGSVTPDYGYEARVSETSPHGGTKQGRVDLYKRGHFIIEAKQSHIPDADKAKNLDLFDPAAAAPAAPSGAKYDKLMEEAFQQARRYAAAVPPSHGWPPFIIVADIGRAFDLYFDWSGIGKNYAFFPDQTHYRITLEDLRQPEKRDLLRAIWTDPKSIDPRLKAVEVTRKVARDLAEITQALEESQKLRLKGAADFEKSLLIEETALFVMRLLFCMFAEDVELLPKGKFAAFLASCLLPDWKNSTAYPVNDNRFRFGLEELWTVMGREGGSRYVQALDASVRYFNGGLFVDKTVFTLDARYLDLLINAAADDWKKVEPAIFGTLLEQALTPAERAKLGAHYTPRPYVERLVDATMMEPLRAEFDALAAAGGDAAALTAFHAKLKGLAVLDPACGTGNFLYVAMELLLRLEGDVIDAIARRGGTAEPGIGPQQFHGLELNPRAAVIAELVLWIGWLRWRLTHAAQVGEPVLQRFGTINFGQHGGYDAVLARLATGEVDDANPRAPAWPDADYIIGNPPFIGKGSAMRAALGDDYVEALWRAHPNVNHSADFVMFWWDRAATILTAPDSRLKGFGLVTTNSITGVFNRRVIERHLNEGASLNFAVPDHPWTKVSRDAAAVRIAMTAATRDATSGTMVNVTGEAGLDTDVPTLDVTITTGRINADLTLGADVSAAHNLTASSGLSCNGMMLAGKGFKLTAKQAADMIAFDGEPAKAVIRPYVNGGDLVQRHSGGYVIDLFGWAEADARQQLPTTYAHLLATVKPERDKNRDGPMNRNWWLFGRSRQEHREAIADLKRFIATTETSKHRLFQFVPITTVPDDVFPEISASLS